MTTRKPHPVYMLAASLMILGGPANAEDSASKQLLGARSLKCVFGPGSAAEWKGGKLTFKGASFNETLHFDSINLKASSARVIGSVGASDVQVVASPSGLTFIEITGFGNIMVTTVFGAHNNEGNLIAVTSRHTSIFDKPMPQQYYGSCKVWE